MQLRSGCGGWPNCPGCIVPSMFRSCKNMVSGGCFILGGDYTYTFSGMGWEHQPEKHASAVEACI